MAKGAGRGEGKQTRASDAGPEADMVEDPPVKKIKRSAAPVSDVKVI